MAETFAGFMAQNVQKEESLKFAVSKRFVDGDGKPLKWEIGAITSQEDEAIRKTCTKKVRTPGDRNKFSIEMDSNKYVGLLSVHCTLYPDLNNAQLQDSYGVMGAEELLKTMLLPGEYANYAKKVQEVNGFDISMDDLVEEAKN